MLFLSQEQISFFYPNYLFDVMIFGFYQLKYGYFIDITFQYFQTIMVLEYSFKNAQFTDQRHIRNKMISKLHILTSSIIQNKSFLNQLTSILSQNHLTFQNRTLAARIIIKYIYLYYYQNIFNMSRVNSPRNLFNTVASDVQYELSRRFMNYAGQQLFHKQNLIMMESNLLIEKLGRLQYKKDYNSYEEDYCHLATLHTLDSSITEINQIPRIRKVFSRKNKNSSFVSKKSSSDQNMTDALSQIKKFCSPKTYQYMRTFTQKYQKLKKNEDQNKASGQLNLSLNGIIRNRCDTDRNNHDQVLSLNIKNQKLEKQNDVLSTKITQLQKKIEQLDLQLNEKQKINLNYSEQLARFQAKMQGKVNQKDSLSDTLSSHLQKIQKFHNNILNALQNIFIEEGCNRCCELIKKIKSSLINYKSTLAEEIELFQSQWQKLNLNMRINV